MPHHLSIVFIHHYFFILLFRKITRAMQKFFKNWTRTTNLRHIQTDKHAPKSYSWTRLQFSKPNQSASPIWTSHIHLQITAPICTMGLGIPMQLLPFWKRGHMIAYSATCKRKASCDGLQANSITITAGLRLATESYNISRLVLIWKAFF